MGILNLTPDSFSDGGAYNTEKKALERLDEMLRCGADIIDIGASSTGPGSKPVGASEELERIGPILKNINTKEVCISVDTYHSEVAATCLKEGAKIINDVSGLRYDNKMASLIAQHKAKVVIMYSKETANFPHASNTEAPKGDIIEIISNFFEQQLRYALSEGIKAVNIILDPGMGAFLSKEHEVSWELLNRLDELTSRFKNHSFLIGVSRKGFLGGKLEDRDAISQEVSADAAAKGADIIRTHNPKMLKEYLKTYNKLLPEQ